MGGDMTVGVAEVLAVVQAVSVVAALAAAVLGDSAGDLAAAEDRRGIGKIKIF